MPHEVSFVKLSAGNVTLEGDLFIPPTAKGLVLFAHGSGSSRLSPRNRFVARQLNDSGLATLLFDLLTAEEEEVDNYTREHRFNIDLLAERLEEATQWVAKNSETKDLTIGYFGASTGAAAALIAAARTPQTISAIVSRGGRPDLAGPYLMQVDSPTLLIVGGDDDVVIDLNQQALDRLQCEKQLVIIEGATHLFEEPGKLEEVAQIAADWFKMHLSRTGGDSIDK